MSSTAITYKRNGVTVTMPGGFHGVCRVTATPYQYPKGHPCRGCPYTLNTTVPSCMFPSNQEAAERIFAFIKVLEAVKRHKGF